VAVVRVAVVLGGNFPRRQLSYVAVVRVTVVRVAVVRVAVVRVAIVLESFSKHATSTA